MLENYVALCNTFLYYFFCMTKVKDEDLRRSALKRNKIVTVRMTVVEHMRLQNYVDKSNGVYSSISDLIRQCLPRELHRRFPKKLRKKQGDMDL